MNDHLYCNNIITNAEPFSDSPFSDAHNNKQTADPSFISFLLVLLYTAPHMRHGTKFRRNPKRIYIFFFFYEWGHEETIPARHHGGLWICDKLLYNGK